ncbi:unnamed protein product, partial [Musa banksii]
MNSNKTDRSLLSISFDEVVFCCTFALTETRKRRCPCHRSRETQIEPGSSLNSSNRTVRALLVCAYVRRSSSDAPNPQAPSSHLLPTLDVELDVRRAKARLGNR